MTDRELMSRLTKLGFPMFQPDEEFDVNKTLADVITSNDMRLWEGFPVLLANAIESYQFDPELVEKNLAEKKQKEIFHKFMLLSGALFSIYHLSFSWWKKKKMTLSQNDKKLFINWKNNLVHDKSFKINDKKIDPERIKGLFELYFEKKAEKNRQRKKRYEEFSLEHALSQIFSPKQKELFKKKLEGLPLTKTEKEYYSRTVKKKVTALANSELHSLAKKVLGI